MADDSRLAPADVAEGGLAAARERYLSSASEPKTPSMQRNGSAASIDPAELPAPGTASGSTSLWQQVSDLRAQLEQALRDTDAARKRAAEKETEARELREKEASSREQVAQVDELRKTLARLEVEAADAAKHRAAAEAVSETLCKERDTAREGLAKAVIAAQEQEVREQELSAQLSAAQADLEVARTENSRMGAELAAVGAARAEMTAAWEKLTAAFAMPMPGMPTSAA